jgi:hypothetical protein
MYNILYKIKNLKKDDEIKNMDQNFDSLKYKLRKFNKKNEKI